MCKQTGNIEHGRERTRMIGNHLGAMLYRLGEPQAEDNGPLLPLHGELDRAEAFMHKLARLV